MMLLAPILLAVGLLVSIGASYLVPSREVRILETSLAQANLSGCDRKFAVNVGAVTLGLGNLAARAADAPKEVRLALNSARGVNVAVYELKTPPNASGIGILLESADARLNKQGWERTVLVRDGGQTVAIYTKGRASKPEQLQACLLVVDGRYLIIASGKANLGPAIEFLEAQGMLTPLRGKLPFRELARLE